MGDYAFETLRHLNRQHFHRIWQSARRGHLGGLIEEEQRLAKIMLAHSDEYFNQFEFADVLGDHKVDPDSVMNPFLHIALHAIVEKQVEDHDPIEAFQFYDAMRQKKLSRHEATHLLAAILIYVLLPVLKEGRRFQLDTYRKLLKEYKSRKPERIMGLLEKEPDLITDKVVDLGPARMLEEMKSALEDQKFGSIEEANAFANALVDSKNREPIPEFMGLSPEQMYRLLHRPLVESSDMVMLNRNLSQEELSGIPIVEEIVYFLRRLSELQPLRATVKGNLPRAFAQEIHDKFPDVPDFPYPITSEEQDWKLVALRHILVMCGWMKKYKQWFRLTRSGQKLVDNGFGLDDFFNLLETYVMKFNWASRDLYPELHLIQQAVLFSCYLLHLKAKTYIGVGELGSYFIQAFPAVLQMVERSPYTTPEESLRRIFSIRFIERFCEYFGLVTIRREKKEFPEVGLFVQTTPLFEKIFKWKLGSPGT